MEITKFSEHCTYFDFIRSTTARLNNIDNTPDKIQIANGKVVAREIYDKVKSNFKQCFISSFFRSLSLNKKIKGSKNSQHMKGEAIDIDSHSNVYNKQIFDWIKDNLEFDQLINEFPDKNGNPSWVHVSFKRQGKNRKQVLTINK
jgi:zinc D-Ala-D-Ala carboxypeptidase